MSTAPLKTTTHKNPNKKIIKKFVKSVMAKVFCMNHLRELYRFCLAGQLI